MDGVRHPRPSKAYAGERINEPFQIIRRYVEREPSFVPRRAGKRDDIRHFSGFIKRIKSFLLSARTNGRREIDRYAIDRREARKDFYNRGQKRMKAASLDLHD